MSMTDTNRERMLFTVLVIVIHPSPLLLFLTSLSLSHHFYLLLKAHVCIVCTRRRFFMHLLCSLSTVPTVLSSIATYHLFLYSCCMFSYWCLYFFFHTPFSIFTLSPFLLLTNGDVVFVISASRTVCMLIVRIYC